MSKPTLTCYGGVGTVTGANFLLETENKKVLVDCGLFQGFQTADEENKGGFEYDVPVIDFLFITHAHIDHIGRILELVRAGFKGVIYSTDETKEIANLMLRDMAHIEGSSEDIVDTVMRIWQTIKYHEPRDFGDFNVELFNAGHILGSAMYKFTFPSGKSMLFSGDIGNSPAPLEGNTEEVSQVSYLLMDSVYGDRNHPSPLLRDAQFRKIIQEVIEKKSTLLIPVFSLERSQIIINDLDRIFESNRNIPVFLDSPLAIKVTDIYRRVLGDKVRDFDFEKFKETTEVRDSMEIANVHGPKIILAGSGMSTAGRIVHHEIRYLPDPNAVILFVGYQAAGTLGRLIQEGMKEVTIKDKKIPVRAKVVTIEGFSAHAGSDQLVEFVSNTKDTLQKVFITMGEPKSSIFLAQRLKDELGVEAVVPERGKKYELDL